MRLTSFVVSRSWASNPLRTGLTVLGVGLGIAIVVAIQIMDHNTIQSRLLERQPDRGTVEMEVRPTATGRSAGAVLLDLQDRPGIAGVGMWLEAPVQVGGRPVVLYGLGPLAEMRPGGAFSHYRLQRGLDLEREDDVLLGIELARDLGVAPGQILSLEPAPYRTICRDGVLQVVEPDRPRQAASVRVRGFLAYDRLGRRALGRVVVGSHGLASRFGLERDTLFQIRRVYGTDLDGLRDALAPDYLVVDPLAASIGEAADERAFRNGIKVLGCLALILGMFVVFQTLSQSLAERLAQIGLLRCLGAPRGAIARIFLCDALAMAMVGAASGIAGGVVLALGLRALQISSLGMLKPWHTFEIPVVPVVWTAAMGVLFTLAGASFPLWKARNLAPLAAIGSRGLDPGRRGGGYVLRGVNVFLFVLLVLVLPLAYLAMTPLVSEEGWETLVVLGQMGGMILLFGLVLLLSPRVTAALGTWLLLPVRSVAPLSAFLMAKSLQRNPGRIAASVCGLSVVLLAMLALQSITWALRGEVRGFAAAALDRRLFLETPAVTPETARALASIPGVAAVDALRGRIRAPFHIAGLPVESLTRAGGALEGFPELAARYQQRRSLVVSPRLALLRGLRAGSAVAVLTDEGPEPYTVLQISDRAGFVPDERAWAVAAPRWLREDFCVPEASVQQISLALSPGANPDAVRQAAVPVLGRVDKAKTGAEIRDYHLRDVTRDFVIFDILLLGILVLATAGLINSMTIAALGRAREIGVLRALGVSSWDLRRMFLLEGVLVGAMATLFVGALGIPLGRMMVFGLNRVARLDAPFEVPWPWLAVVPLLALGAGLCSAVLPGLRASRQDPARSVRYE